MRPDHHFLRTLGPPLPSPVLSLPLPLAGGRGGGGGSRVLTLIWQRSTRSRATDRRDSSALAFFAPHVPETGEATIR